MPKFRACVAPNCTPLSQAMFRVAEALTRFAPPDVEIVGAPALADVVLLHTIGPWTKLPPRYVVIQYCLQTTDVSHESWHRLWRGALLVWSYYDLVPHGIGANFHYAPLGVDPFMFYPRYVASRDVAIMTSGYVNGPRAEAIEECAEAARQLDLRAVHLGPENVEGMALRTEATWQAAHGISDEALAQLYSRSRFVSGLRHGEGFELPVLEGTACGATPIVFDRPEMRHWFGELGARFVPESCGDELVAHLKQVLQGPAEPLEPLRRRSALADFHWSFVARQFWLRLLEEL